MTVAPPFPPHPARLPAPSGAGPGRPRPGRLGAVVIALAALPAGAEELPAIVDYNRDVRPLISNTCLRCHGPDEKSNPSGLRLDRPEAAYSPRKDKSGRTITALVPGKPEASEAWRRIASADPAAVMPPPDAIHQLTARDKALLRRWIEQGAKYQAHWAYVPPVKRDPPHPPAADPSVTHPIDRFISAALRRRGLALSPRADRATLARRLSLDLIGLPPPPAEVVAFAADPRSDDAAAAAYVDRLLASPHYGERMAVPWLDLVRFADSAGLHGDQLYNNFPYRDYVIDAFNRDLPFDRFTIEQIAGDLLPEPTVGQRVASGFNRLNQVTREGGAQVGEYLAKYASDRVRTVSTAWLGSTLACAECHDHKYDPFTTRDFYAFAAYFADVQQWGVYRHFVYTPEPDLAVHTDNYPFPPEIEVTSPYLQRRAERLRTAFLERERGAARTLLARPEGGDAVRAWARQISPLLAHDAGWAASPVAAAASTNGVASLTQEDGSVRFENPAGYLDKKYTQKPTRHELQLTAPAVPISTVRLAVLPDPGFAGFVTRDRRDWFEISVSFSVQRSGAASPAPIEVAEAFAENETENYFNGRPLVSVREIWRSARTLARARQSAVFQLSSPLTLGPGDRLIATVVTAPVNFHQRSYLGEVGRIQFSVSPLGCALPGEASAAPNPVGGLEAMAASYVRATATFSDPAGRNALREILECREGRASSLVSVSVPPRVTRVLPRGNWQDESGEVVAPAPPHFLASSPPPGSGRQSRLDLARWIASTSNPLTARTFVNRLWRQFIGTGLSAAVEDLGMQGEYPSHPELLDWLAVEFMERGWEVKALVRLIVSSATYQQASRDRPELREADPANRLLGRQSARRLEAEFIRDLALASGGLLHAEIGGPSAHPYQPPGYYEQLNFPLREYRADSDERQHRRGLYVHWQRTFLHPMLANFDAPSREECTAARNLSTTPQQALTLLNDPTFVEAARALAETLLAAEPERRLDLAFQRVLSRPPEERERRSLEAFHAAHLAAFRERPADAAAFIAIGLRPVPAHLDRAELAAWTAVGRALLNLHEAITRY